MYEAWVKGIGRLYDSDFNRDAIALPESDMPRPRELTPKEVFSLLSYYAKEEIEPRSLLKKLREIHWVGFSPAEGSFQRWVERVIGMSNEDIARCLSGDTSIRRSTTLRNRLITLLDTTPGPDGSLAEDTGWKTWIDEEIRFWLLEGYPAPRIAHKMWPEHCSVPESLDGAAGTEENWRKTMGILNKALRSLRANGGNGKIEDFLRDEASGVSGWLAALRKCAAKRGAEIRKRDWLTAKKTDLDVRTIQAALKRHGFAWRSAGRPDGFREWSKESRLTSSTRKGKAKPQNLKF